MGEAKVALEDLQDLNFTKNGKLQKGNFTKNGELGQSCIYTHQGAILLQCNPLSLWPQATGIIAQAYWE